MKKYRLRLFVYLILAISLIGLLSYTCMSKWKNIYENKKLKKELEATYSELLKNQDNLESEVVRLQDPEYVAKYAREKYMYTKKDELIIDMTSNK